MAADVVSQNPLRRYDGFPRGVRSFRAGARGCRVQRRARPTGTMTTTVDEADHTYIQGCGVNDTPFAADSKTRLTLNLVCKPCMGKNMKKGFFLSIGLVV